MNYRLLFLTFIFGILIGCESPKEEVQIEGITERTQEEIENLKDFAPAFSFQSIDGNQVSLADLKGKYVYVDIWATWCGPCLQQLPAMKELEEKYRGQNIEFLSISVDNEKDKAKWQKMVNEKEMKGVQLYAGTTSSFHKDYGIRTIPKFLLIGKEGEILDKNPPRPMNYSTRQINKDLVSVFDNLLKQ